MTQLGREIAMYARYVLALLLPGWRVPTFSVYTLTPGPMAGWSDDEYRLLVDEGRRQIERHAREHERIQSRSQFLFTTALALLVVLAASARRIANEENIILFLLWAGGMAVVALGVLGAGALLAVRADLRTIDAALLSQQPAGDVLTQLAHSYARMMGTGEETVATRLTIYRDAVVLVLLGSVVDVIAWGFILV